MCDLGGQREKIYVIQRGLETTVLISKCCFFRICFLRKVGEGNNRINLCKLHFVGYGLVLRAKSFTFCLHWPLDVVAHGAKVVFMLYQHSNGGVYHNHSVTLIPRLIIYNLFLDCRKGSQIVGQVLSICALTRAPYIMLIGGECEPRLRLHCVARNESQDTNEDSYNIHFIVLFAFQYLIF